MKAVYVLCSPLSVDFGGEAEHALHSAGSGIFFQLFRKVVLYSHTIFFHNISISPILSPLRNPTPTDLWTLIGVGIMVERIRDRKTWTFFVVCLDDLHLLGFQV